VKPLQLLMYTGETPIDLADVTMRNSSQAIG